MKRRGKNPNENPGVRPVQSIELNESGSKKRMILAIILLAFGLALVAYALIGWLRVEPGWIEVGITESTVETVAGDIVFQYELGSKGGSVRVERNDVSAIFTEASSEAYKIFCPDKSFDGVNNLHYLGEHIGEEVAVHPVLYEALELLEKYGSRELYLAPLASEYYNLFMSAEDINTADFDPYQNKEVAEYFKKIADFVSSEEAVNIELLGDNKVKLTVSEEYRAFAEENGIEHFLDFYMSRNAFAVDYIAKRLTDAGFTGGNLTSHDGFTRNLDSREYPYSYNLFDRDGKKIYVAARLDYVGANSIVLFRDYSLSERDFTFYMMSDGESRHGYIDTEDGLCKNSLENLVCYSKDLGCAEIYLSSRHIYVSETFDPELTEELHGLGIDFIWFEGTELRYTGSPAISDLYSKDGVTYTKK